MADSATECPICFEKYEAPPSQLAPVNLPCGHTFCREHAASQVGQADGGARGGNGREEGPGRSASAGMGSLQRR